MSSSLPFLCFVFSFCVRCGYSARIQSEKDTEILQISPYIIAAGCVSVVILVLVLSLCGGCTPMEVGSDQHEAAGGRSYNQSSNYTTGYTDVNTRVLTSGTNVANDQYHPNDNNSLPYPVRPQTDNNFAGYSTQQHGYQPQGNQPQQGYQQYGTPQHGTPQYGSQPSYQQQQSIPGSNRHIMDDSEPPPPSYNEALTHQARNQTNASAPSYGW